MAIRTRPAAPDFMDDNPAMDERDKKTLANSIVSDGGDDAPEGSGEARSIVIECLAGDSGDVYVVVSIGEDGNVDQQRFEGPDAQQQTLAHVQSIL